MAAGPSAGPKLFLAAAGVALAFCLAQDLRLRDKGLAVLVDAQEARALCRASGYPEPDFWERLRVMGALGAALRPERLEAYLRDEQVLRFTGREIEKMRAAGVAAKGAVSPDTLWVRDEGLLTRLLSAARRRGLPLAARRRSGMYVVRLPEGVKPEELPMGYDPARVSLISEKGLLPAYWVEDPDDLWPDGPREGAAPLLLLERGGLQADRLARLRDQLGQRKAWLALTGTGAGDLPSALLRDGADAALLSRTLIAGPFDPRSALAGALRASMISGDRILVARLDQEAGVERNLDALRGLLRGLRSRGYHPGLPPTERDERVLSGAEMYARYLLALCIALFGPILAMRWGLEVLRWAQQDGRWPEASPVREALLACSMVTASAAAAGLAAYALLAVSQWRLGLFPMGWSAWAASAPLLVGFLALYVPDVADWDVFFRRMAPRGRGLAVVLAVGAACVLLAPPRWLQGKGPGAWLSAAAIARPSWWWLATRWREVLVGYPCLVAGFWAYFWRRDSGPRAGGDPRAWLFLALLGPIGVIDVLARARVPFELALAQTVQGAALGCALGLGAVGLRQVPELLRSQRAERAGQAPG